MTQRSQAASGTAVDRILEQNRAFVARHSARPLPPVETKRLAVVACYDPRLDALLLQALGLEPGEAFMLRTAGALVQPQGGVMRSLGLAVFMFGVTEIVVVGHTSCRMATFKNAEFVDLFRKRGVPREAFGADDLRQWAGAIIDPPRGVEASIRNIAAAPTLPRDVAVSGLVLDDETGALELVEAGEAREVSPIVEAAAPEPEAAREGAAQPPTSAQPQAPDVDLLMAWVGQWLKALETKDAWKGEVQKLRKDLATTPSPLARLRRLETFARKASGESREMIRAFEQIKHQVQTAPHGKVPDGILRFFQRWSGGAS